MQESVSQTKKTHCKLKFFYALIKRIPDLGRCDDDSEHEEFATRARWKRNVALIFKQSSSIFCTCSSETGWLTGCLIFPPKQTKYHSDAHFPMFPYLIVTTHWIDSDQLHVTNFNTMEPERRVNNNPSKTLVYLHTVNASLIFSIMCGSVRSEVC